MGRFDRYGSILAEHAGERPQRPPDPLGCAHQLYAAAGWSSLPWLGRLPQPTLVVGGERDPSVPLHNARLLADRVPHARLHAVKDGGHRFLLDEPRTSPPRSGRFLDVV